MTRQRLILALTLVLGTVTLSVTLRLPPGHAAFVPAALATAAIWLAGALACGPLPLRGTGTRARQVGLGVAVGTGAMLLCLAIGVVVSEIPILAGPAEELLAHRSTEALPLIVLITVLGGLAEEAFFRGALYDALPEASAWLFTAVLYALATLPSGIVLLSAAAALLGVLTGLLRRSTGGLASPIATHLVWSLGMLLLLPSVLD